MRNAAQLDVPSTLRTTIVTVLSPFAPRVVDVIVNFPFGAFAALASPGGALAFAAASAIASGVPFLGRGAGVGSTLAVTTLLAPMLRLFKLIV